MGLIQTQGHGLIIGERYKIWKAKVVDAQEKSGQLLTILLLLLTNNL